MGTKKNGSKKNSNCLFSKHWKSGNFERTSRADFEAAKNNQGKPTKEMKCRCAICGDMFALNSEDEELLNDGEITPPTMCYDCYYDDLNNYQEVDYYSDADNGL
jgi:hypothetical protein